ncbi:hypothetical protein DPMN_039340 [Dreissena polymorpha]|uniref:Uncharacterized protein n=1 Tax=Dreissena polymorpha TaxID=45954 RepID=A0A9D4RRJ1_DREPO|nr:hypothetical protein DPMN_039340 [Dreissena polymorpha]
MNIEHRPGRLHGNPDGLIRKPFKQCSREKDGISVKSINEACSAGLNLSEVQDADNTFSRLKYWVEAAENEI